MRRPILILLILLGLSVIYSFVIEPVNEWNSQNLEELYVKTRTLSKLEQVLEASVDTEQQVTDAVSELDNLSSLLIDVENDALGFARLNSYIQDLMQSTGMEIVSLKPLNVVKYKLYAGLPLQINATADVKQINDFLQKLSSGKYLISVDTINIRVMNVRKPDKVRVKIEVSGYREI
ncbi:MAG: type 4a pilus biogenesis protein PilO [Nitrospirota bacterium]|nr:MAG: type 4a pilus biogenesis protein PilO [Nitrospirota bacterium]